MKLEREDQAQLCGKQTRDRERERKRERERESTRGPCTCFAPVPRKPHPNLVPPLKDNWLTRLPHPIHTYIQIVYTHTHTNKTHTHTNKTIYLHKDSIAVSALRGKNMMGLPALMMSSQLQWEHPALRVYTSVLYFGQATSSFCARFFYLLQYYCRIKSGTKCGVQDIYELLSPLRPKHSQTF